MNKRTAIPGFAALRQVLLALMFVLMALLSPGTSMAQATGASFNHDTTMFPLRGAHEVVRCETCHINGVFKGTPKECNLCHIQGSRTGAMPMPNNHIPITQQCDACHNTSTFAGTQFTHAMVMPGTCNTCHNGYYAQGKSPSPPHPVTTASCDQCHSIGSFTNAIRFDHAAAGIFAAPSHAGPACSSCHNGIRAEGKTPTHVPVPATSNCDDCHRQTTAWKPALFSHEAAGISSNPKLGAACSSCHNNNPYLGIPAGTAHIPTVQDCSVCHSNSPIINPGGFALGAMVHTGITNNCQTCHGYNSPYPPLAGKALVTPTAISNHIPVQGIDCVACHATGSFDNFSGAVMNHSVVTAQTCASCHEDGKNYAGLTKSTPLVMRSTDGTHYPMPTSVPCSACHGSVTSFAQSINYSATGVHQSAVVSQGCNVCHNDGTGPFAAQTSIVVKANTASLSVNGMPHIPFTAGTDCSTCHVSSAIPSFTPGSNGFRLAGGGSPANPSLTGPLHTYVSADCTSCHGALNVPGAQYAGMVASTNTTANDTFPTATFDSAHQSYTGNCSTCHSVNPVFASNLLGAFAKPAGHIPTGALACATCHTTPNVFTNPNLVATHTTGQACAVCHNSAQSSAAASLGTPVIVFNDPSLHIPIGSLGNTSAASGTATCDGSGCHSNYAAAGSVFKIGVGSAGNITTPTMSVTAHNTVLSAGVTSCSSCHDAGKVFQGMVATSTVATVATSTVATGATSTVATGAAGDTRPALTFDAKHPTTGDCGACHTTSPTFQLNVTNASGRPAAHIPTAAAVCSACHVSTAALSTAFNYPLPDVGLTHSSAASQGQACSACHNATVSAAIAASSPAIGTATVYNTSTHFPIGSLDCASSGCHKAYATGSVTSFVLGAANPSTNFVLGNGGVNVHTSVTGMSCSGCHAQNSGFLGMVSNPATVPSDVVPATSVDAVHANFTGDCGACHTTVAMFKTNPTALPPKHIPLGNLATTCSNCHAGGNYSAAAANLVTTHTSTQTCLTCHGSGVAGTFLVDAAMPIKTETAIANHIPIGSTDCVACHANYTATGAVFKIGTGAGNINSPTLTVAGHTAVAAGGQTTCGTCHTQPGGTVYAGMLPTQVGGGDQFPNATEDANHASYTGDCVTCHTTSPTFKTNAVAKPAAHIPVGTAACSACHTTSGVYTSYDLAAAHTVTGQACSACHNSTVSTALANASPSIGKATVYTGSSGVNHIAIGTLDCASSGCHATYAASGGTSTGGGSFVIGSGAGGNVNTPTLNVAGHTTLLNGLPGTRCDSCHTNANSGTSVFTGMVAGNTLQSDQFPLTSLDSKHPAFGTDCGTCHTTSPTFSSNNSGGSLPSNHIPLSAFPATPACSACHINSATYNTARMNHSPSTGAITSACITCHGAGGVALVFANVKPTPQPAKHIPTTVGALGNACEKCHRNAVTNNFNSFAGTVMDHTGVTSSCITCHATTQVSAYTGVTMVVAPNASTDGHQYVATLACETCHTNSTVTGGFANGTFVHSTVSGKTCMSCHEIGSKFTGVSNLWVRESANHNAGKDCGGSGCHKTSDKALGTGITAEAIPQYVPAASSTIVFSASAIGGTVVKSIALNNSGTAALAITSVALSGTNSADYTQTNTCGTSLAAGANCSISVTFKPSAAGARAGTLTVTDNAGGKTGSTQTFTLSGAVATTTLSANAVVALSSTAIGTVSPIQVLTFSNTGAAAVSFTAPVISGANAADFKATSTCGTSVAAAASCTISLTFTPTINTAQETALLTIANGGLPASYVLQLVGSTGVQSAAALQRRVTGGIAVKAPAGSGAGSPAGSTTVAGTATTGGVVNGTPVASTTSSTVAGTTTSGTKPAASGVLPASVAAVLGAGNLPAGNSMIIARGASHGPTVFGALPTGMAFNHVNVTPGSCVTCHDGAVHNGVVVTGKPANHIPSSSQCDQCHRTTAWLPALFSHASVAGVPCLTCHNGHTAVQGLPAHHMLTSRACNVCHNTNGWTPVFYQHMSPRYVATARNAGLPCISCHIGNTEMAPVAGVAPAVGGTRAKPH